MKIKILVFSKVKKVPMGSLEYNYECTWACVGVHVCAGVYSCAWACMKVCQLVQVCVGARGYALAF